MTLVRCCALLIAVMLSGTAHGQAVESTAHAPFPAFESAPRRPLLLSPDGRHLYALNPADHRLEVFAVNDVGPHRFLGEVFTGLEPVAMTLAYTGSDHGSVDPTAANGTVVPARPGNDGPSDRMADTMFVANALSDSVAVVNLSTLAVTDVIDVGDEPTDVRVVDDKLFVTCARAPRDPDRPLGPGNRHVEGVLQVYDVDSRKRLRQIQLGLVQPRAMASHGRFLFVAPQHGGTRTITLTHRRMRRRRAPRTSVNAELQSRNPTLYSPRLAERDGAGWNRPHTGLILNEVDAGRPMHADRDLIAINLDSLEVEPAANIELGSSFFALESFADRLWLAGIRGFNLGDSEPELSGSAFDNLVYEVEPTPGGSAVQHQIDDMEEVVSYAMPVAVAGFEDGDHTRIFVAAMGSGAIVELDAEEDFVHAVGCEELPMGLALDGDRRHLHVWCRNGPEIVTYSVGQPGEQALTLISRTPVSYDPEPPLFARGRVHMYDARDDHGNGSFGCASCHQFGDHDQMAWNLGDPGGGITAPYAAVLEKSRTPVNDASMPQMHPLKGPMMTQSLRGLDGVQPLHWRGDRRFVHSFRGAFRGLQGGNGLSLHDMQELATFLDALQFPPNPHQPREVDDPQIARGEELFHGNETTAGCIQCHRRFDGQGPDSPQAGRLFAAGQPQLIKAPDLRGAYTKESGAILGFGPGHEGAAPDLRQFLEIHPPLPDASLDALTDEDKDALAAFVRAFDSGVDPFVGWQRAWNADTLADVDAWLQRVLERRQHVQIQGAPRFDVVVKLWQQPEPGVPTGASLAGNGQDVPASPPAPLGAVLIGTENGEGIFLGDDGFRREWSSLRADVRRGELSGYALVVPPGTGLRLGVDRDEDGLFDRIERERLGTDGASADTDGDGIDDGREVLALGTEPLQPTSDHNTAAARILSHRVIGRFSSTATLEVVMDSPAALHVALDLGSPEPRVVERSELRRRHQVLLEKLPAGQEIAYSVRSRKGTTTTNGSFRTHPPALHIDDIKLEQESGGIVARVRVVDQDESPVTGVEVQLLWHHASDEDRAIARRLDQIARAVTAEDGIAVFRRDGESLPDARTLVSVGVLGLGSQDPEDRYFVGFAGDVPPFFYEQPLNGANSASLLVD